MPKLRIAPLLTVVAFIGNPRVAAEEKQVFESTIRPLVQKYCLGCHSTEKKKGKLDLERFRTQADISGHGKVWQAVVEQLNLGEMPPEKKPQPTAQERGQLLSAVGKVLEVEALAQAGDPGPVVLRRLSNSEYTYTIRDLTGIELDPAKEFPVDGAAGEGFTNVGDALVMSPGLFSKYFDAAKKITRHAVLIPGGFHFSEGTTARDFTDEYLRQIRSIYASNTNDGRIDLARYVTALIRHRERLRKDPGSAGQAAVEEKLNAKYFKILATMLVSDQPSSMLLNQIRGRWRSAKPEEGPAIAGDIRSWQGKLWKFNKIGTFGSIRLWQEPVSLLSEKISFREDMNRRIGGKGEVNLYLASGNAGDESKSDVAVWRRPRFEFKGRKPMLLRDVRRIAWQIENEIRKELRRTHLYLKAVAGLQATTTTVQAQAEGSDLNAALLQKWTECVNLGQRVEGKISGHFKHKFSNVHGYEAIEGWGKMPSLMVNKSKATIKFLTLTVPPRSVSMHPSPDKDVAVGWRSPMNGQVKIEGRVADADNKCGNGAAWTLELLSGGGVEVLASGVFDNGRDESFKLKEPIAVGKGDFVSLVMGPRDRNHTCDTTHVEIILTDAVPEGRTWKLSDDVIDDIHAGNPHPDKHGNPDTWHFYVRAAPKKKTSHSLPNGSSIARWKKAMQDEAVPEELDELALAVTAVISAPADKRSAADKRMVQTLESWEGPLQWVSIVPIDEIASKNEEVQEGDSRYGLASKDFGQLGADKESLAINAPVAVEVRLPSALVRNGHFVVDGEVLKNEEGDGSVQPRLLWQKPASLTSLIPGVPVVARPGSESWKTFDKAAKDFQEFFPAAMCHARIVPVDEVVTLLQFHREDHQLARLMLDDKTVAELDRLWDEMHYVSRDILTTVDAYEQLWQYATQDADPKILEPLEKPIRERAAAFRKRLIDTEPKHVKALIDFAGRAWRRPLSAEEQQGIKTLYGELRSSDVPHEEAIRLTLARVFTSSAFLYRLEKPAGGEKAEPVSDWELASRLSYFLWSSMPDEQLREDAATGHLHEDKTILSHTKRMLKDARVRRLAVEFACQWLHLRDFDQHDEKSERHFPEFAKLRGDMYEETIHFFTDLFQNDGSVLSILDADHTFLNGALAKHYGLGGVAGAEWRKVSKVRERGRGGILTHATFLSKQSGASRTSPILRGNWIAEVLLGEKLPRPPADVPQLPEDESKEGLTMRQLVEKHAKDPRCFGCHKRIDPYGFALENFDAIGRRRDKDMGNRPIDTNATLMDGEKISGVDGLRSYLVNKRLDAFLKQFSRKLLGYALGRATQLSDEPLLKIMVTKLQSSNYRFSNAVELIVTSPQFRQIRGRQQK